MRTLNRTLLTASLLALGTAGFAQTNRTFTSQYTFGDSLSDNGNVYALTNRTTPPAPYFQGRFSNGPVFTELLGNTLAPHSTVSAQRGNLNFAYGGATAGSGGAVPTVTQQIGFYRLQGLPSARTDLFTILAGPNDLIPVLSAATTPGNPAVLDTAGFNTAVTVAGHVQTLAGLGAKTIVAAGMPNLGITPRSLAAGSTGSALGQRASAAFNNEFRARLGAIAASAAADVNIVYVDLQGILDRVAADYRALGFANATSYFLAPAAAGGGVGDPNSYVFWDDIHPTARTHALLAAVITEQLNPEIPLGFGATLGTASLALAGLGATALDDRAAQLAFSDRATGRADAYVSFNYGDGERDRDGWRPGFDFDAQVITAGVDLRLGDGVFVGGALQRGRLDADVAGGRGDFAVEDGAARLYAVWRGGPVSLLLDGSFGVLDVKGITRTTAFGGFAANGKTGGEHWGAGIKAAWATAVGGTQVRPWLGLRTTRAKLDGYREKDVPALAMDFAAQDAKSSAGAVGVDAAMPCKLGGRAARFDLRAAWHGEFGHRTRAVAGRLADNFTRSTALAVEDGDGDGLQLGGAATLFLAKNASASLGYTAEVRSGEKVASRFSLSVQTGF